jgi:3-oxoacyl-[acyl-carrier-protein] synthase-3
MAGCVPKRTIKTLECTQYFPASDVRKIAEKTGIYERRFTNDDTCSSDLCYAAAEQLFADMQVDRNEIDVLLFVSQTADYRMPATSILLQERLHLPKSTIAFDINLGCSAFLYGLSVASTFLSQPNIRRVLILDGETRSKVYSPKDRKTAFLFGDGAVAVLVGRDEKFGDSWFSLNSDGSRADFIKINGGGYRNPSSIETLRERVVDEYGNIRNDEQGYMDGESVFNFVAVEIPRDVKRLAKVASVDLASLDYYVFHQANNFMNQFLVKKLDLDSNKIPSTIAKYGNTSSVSVPLTIVSELKDKLNGNHNVMLSAFGVGLTWGTAFIPFVDCAISGIVEI